MEVIDNDVLQVDDLVKIEESYRRILYFKCNDMNLTKNYNPRVNEFNINKNIIIQYDSFYAKGQKWVKMDKNSIDLLGHRMTMDLLNDISDYFSGKRKAKKRLVNIKTNKIINSDIIDESKDFYVTSTKRVYHKDEYYINNVEIPPNNIKIDKNSNITYKTQSNYYAINLGNEKNDMDLINILKYYAMVLNNINNEKF